MIIYCLSAFTKGFSQADSVYANPFFDHWEKHELIHGGRIDAITSLNYNIILAATRAPHPGHVFRSTDNGQTWKDLGGIVDSSRDGGITCLAGTREGLAYLLTEQSTFWRSEDFGKTWQYVTKLSPGKNDEGYALAYSIAVTEQGTVLVADANSMGGHIYRSTDQGRHFKDQGKISDRPLYRLQKAAMGIVVNGWMGVLYKSTDDGQTWDSTFSIDNSPLFGIEYIGATSIIQSSQSGGIFSGHDDKWKQTGFMKDIGDDFVNISNGVLLYSTYTGSKHIYLSMDNGFTWKNIGNTGTGVEGDWLDHVIADYDAPDSITVLGGTSKGFVLRTVISRNDLYRLTQDRVKKERMRLSGLQIDFKEALASYRVDHKELNEAEDVLIDGHYAYIPCRDGHNVAIFDIKNPRNPSLVCSYRDPELLDAMGVAKNGNILYITSLTDHKLLIVDVSDPAHPVKQSALIIGGLGRSTDRVRKVCYEDGYAYVTHSSEGTLYIVNVKDPKHPTITGSIDTKDGAFAVFVKGNYAYVGGCFPGSSLKIIDVSDKSHPRLLQTLSDEKNYGCTCSFQNEGDNLFAIAYSSNTFINFNIQHPAQTLENGIIQSPLLDGPNRIIVKGKYAFQINSINDTFTILDVSDPVHPVIKYILNDRLLRKVYGMNVKDGFAYLVGREAKSFVVLDLRKWIE